MEIDFGTGLFGIEFPAGGEQNAAETGRKVFYFDASGSFARGSGDLTFMQTVTGRKRINTVKIRLEVE
jgi:hypothetical protein